MTTSGGQIIGVIIGIVLLGVIYLAVKNKY
jgi:hypothetical protein